MLSAEKIIEGDVLLINKPLRWTSFDVVNKLRGMLTQVAGKKPKVGHAGTLDPLATGLLIIGTGKMTKKLNELQGQEKEYTGAFTLGSATPSFDFETEVCQTFPTAHITEKMIRNTAKKFTGVIRQIPPAYSAVKMGGRRAYDLARAGKTVEVKPREITITLFEITKIKMPWVEFRIVCSKGTYIRSLANDFGKALNSGAFLFSLCRTRIGNFHLKDACSMQEFGKKIGVEFTSEKRNFAVSKKNFH